MKSNNDKYYIKDINFILVDSYKPHKEHIWIHFICSARGEILGNFVGDSVFDTKFRTMIETYFSKLYLKGVNVNPSHHARIKFVRAEVSLRPLKLSREELLQRKITILKNRYEHNKKILSGSLFSDAELATLEHQYNQELFKLQY